MLSLNKQAPAERALTEFWHTCPRYDVFNKWLETIMDNNSAITSDKIDKMWKKIEQLIEPKLKNPDENFIANLCAGKAAIQFGKIEKARKYLTESYRYSSNKAVLRQLAVLEQKVGDESAASDWLSQAIEAEDLSQPGDDILNMYQDFRKKYGLDSNSNNNGGSLSGGAKYVDATRLLSN